MKKQVRHSLDGLLALVIFGVFAVSIIAVLLTGARAYRRLTLRDQEAYDRRTALQYVATRVRQSDSRNAMHVEDFGGVPCLVLGEIGWETDYVTRVYYYDGWVRELFAEEDTDLEPLDGEKVLEVEDLSFELEDGLLTVTATTNGETSTLFLTLRSDAEEEVWE